VEETNVTPTQSNLLEIQDINQSPTKMSYKEALRRILRKLSLKAFIKDAQSNTWKTLQEDSDFRFASSAPERFRGNAISGIIITSSNPKRLLENYKILGDSKLGIPSLI
jgi:hypothetical protein